MFDDILVPVDGSDHAEAAAERALALAEIHGATVHALYVVDTDTSWLTVSKNEVENSLRELGENVGRDVLASFERLAGRYDVPVSTEMAEGSVEDVILAHEDDVDLVVMGTHGREGVTRRIVGSVAERVVRRATVPVMTVTADPDSI